MNYTPTQMSIEQRQSLMSSLNDIVMSMQVRDDSINQLIKIIICEAIFLKKYDVLQNLATNNLLN